MPNFIPPQQGQAGQQQQQQQAGGAAGTSRAPSSTTTSSASPTSNTTSATPQANGATATPAAGARPPFLFPPFPFLPFTVPPPQPPPNFSGLSDAELEEMEGRERSNVEARIKCLRNIQVLLDAAVMEMQQYSAVVSRINTSAASASRSTSASSESKDSSSSTTTTTTASSDVVDDSNGNQTVTETRKDETKTEESASATSSDMSNNVTSSSDVTVPLKDPSETGARPKVPKVASSTRSEVNSAEVQPRESEELPKNASLLKANEEKETSTDVKGIENPFNAILDDSNRSLSDQEEIRKRRLAVFEEQKK